jgi:DNA-binding response OmpR family regulator
MEGKKILMIDDDTCFLEVMKYFLEMEKYQFTGLIGTDDIISVVRSVKPDLVLLDYLLPYKNGRDLCCNIRGCRGCEHLPIVLISAYPQEQLSLYNVPFSMFIPKPFDLWYLLACMKKLLKHQVGSAA